MSKTQNQSSQKLSSQLLGTAEQSSTSIADSLRDTSGRFKVLTGFFMLPEKKMKRGLSEERRLIPFIFTCNLKETWKSHEKLKYSKTLFQN